MGVPIPLPAARCTQRAPDRATEDFASGSAVGNVQISHSLSMK
jgi:hypothetical protein